eukprot:CAMPEP_0195522002 /NCGR_PEP_ID=MMETSP0794_2-20130614/19861_1 /TAXON_ID=515487 /ORGANISM="Stephanopyxis turris, Strain CCMP 815" /LENGTH=185 /DNA_ID=CAMNT_0040651673 /DNA_START=15 /DNA_END=569 /DNA_ORIENTATION=-
MAVTLDPAIVDPVDAGSPNILESPHVSEGPGRIANAPVPSVFADDRGEIHRLRVGHKRINLLYSKPNVMRSGYLHPNKTHDFVISGKVEVWLLTTACTEKKVYRKGESFTVEPYVPHILHFLEDTILCEWWGEGEFRCWYYHPYRRIIDINNSKLAPSVGQFQRLVSTHDLMGSPIDAIDLEDSW